METSPSFVRRYRWPLVVLAAVLAVTVVAPFVYINLIREDAPERLTLDDVPAAGEPDGTTTTTGAAEAEPPPEGVEGTWVVSDGSQVGYRVPETLFGQSAEAVGRTGEATGTLTISGTTVEAGDFTVDMASVTSDESNRDNQFRGRIMDTATHPEATFVLTDPIELGAVPVDGEELTAEAVGDLTLRGVTQSVTIPLTAVLDGATFAVNGAIPLDFDAFDIPDASGGPASVGRTGELEILLVFSR
ncbi:MAG: YceI family protein [Acidimicrobiales bacterium]